MATFLRPVPDTPPRAILYLRQSVSRDDSISLDLQEAAGRAYCLQKGYQVVGVESDPGISGRTWKRPAVTRVMSLVEDGQADVIVLWKWSRLSRSRRDWAIAADRVDVAGGRIESATEDVDISTATGRLARGMLVEFAAFESDRIGDVWKEVHASRVAAGKTPNGLPKWGYVWNRDEQIHQVDPVAGPAFAELYERYVAGESFATMASSLNFRCLTTTKGNMWSATSLIRVMDAGFAAGFIPWHGALHPGNHEALITPQLWQAYLDARARRHYVPPKSKVSKYLLTGILKCGKCGGSMTGGKGNGRGEAYRCTNRKTKGPAACTVTSVQVRTVETRLLAWVATVASKVEEASAIAAEASVRRLSAEAEVSRLGAELQRLDKAMQRLTVQVAEGLVPETAYAGAWAELEGKYHAVQAQLEVQARLTREVAVDHKEIATGLLAEWDELELAQAREMVRTLVSGLRTISGGATGVKGHRGAVSFATVEVLPAWSEEWVSI